jgi:hypothetical protein
MFQIASQSNVAKLFPKIVPQSTSAKQLPQSGMLRICCAKRLPKAILQSGPESCSPKLLPKAAPQSCVLSPWGSPHSWDGLLPGDTKNCIRVQIRGRSCAKAFDRYKTQCIRCATTKFSPWYLFCSYKIQHTTFSDSEHNSKSALQNPMHLKLKNSWKSELLSWFFPMTFCSWVYAIQSSDQHNFGEHFVVVNDWIWLDQGLTPCNLLDGIL